MLAVLPLWNVKRSVLAVGFAAVALTASACGGSDAADQAQIAEIAPTPVATTAPIALPTPSPVPTAVPAPTTAPLDPTATPVPSPTAEPTAAPASDAAPAPTATPTVAPAVEPERAETPTPLPTATPVSQSEPTVEPTAEAATPTAVVPAAGEPPLECYDPVLDVYRAFVEGVDELAFEAGKVSCTGAGSNAVSASRSYRHSSGLIVQRNADFVFNAEGTGYIPYSGSLHFCLEGQPSSSAFVAESVPALLVVIDSEALQQVAQGAAAPAGFDNGQARC